MSKRYIAILRGINVGGKRKILMKDLRDMFLKLGFIEVETYIQSGNIIFSLPKGELEKGLSEKLEKAISEKFEFEVLVIILTSEEIEQAVLENPFLQQENFPVDNLHITFLREITNPQDHEKIRIYDPSPDRFVIYGKIVFVYCSGKYHESRLTNGFFEKKLKTSATTRNLKTVMKLRDLSQKAQV